MAAKQRAEFAVVFLFVFDDVVEDGDGAFVTQIFQLLAVVGDVAAFFDFEAAQGHQGPPGLARQRSGLSLWISLVSGRLATEILDAAGPQVGMLQLGLRQMTKDGGPQAVRVAIGEGEVGIVPLHFRLPVALKTRQHLAQASILPRIERHRFLLILS